jgi:hypothetical protein
LCFWDAPQPIKLNNINLNKYPSSYKAKAKNNDNKAKNKNSPQQ